MAVTSSTRITLADMRFHVLVGILPHERLHPQPLHIDLTVTLVPGVPGVVDYRDLYAMVAEVVNTGDLQYLERLGDAIASRAMERQEISSARVGLRKPHVALDGPLSYAEVVVERHRTHA